MAICVDQAPDCKVGDEVVLIGRQGDECISLDYMSNCIAKIPAEFMSQLLERVPRIPYED